MLSLQVVEKREIAEGIYLIALQSFDRSDLLPFSAGAHIRVMTPNGMQRRYSLCSDPAERNKYLIAVKKETRGSGGSLSMTEDLKVGDFLTTFEPENYFPIHETVASSLLIAGGIGVTPIRSMARHLTAKGAPFRVIYCARSPETAAFLDEFTSGTLAERTTIHHDHGDVGRSFNFIDALREQPKDTHLFCCGPRALMQSVREAAANWSSGYVHFEDFGTDASTTETDHPFRVHLEKTKRMVDVPAGVSIIEALRNSGVDVPSSCESGTCGTCRTTLLAGVADHRDFVLEEEEQDTNIMICVSRALYDELTLDI